MSYGIISFRLMCSGCEACCVWLGDVKATCKVAITAVAFHTAKTSPSPFSGRAATERGQHASVLSPLQLMYDDIHKRCYVPADEGVFGPRGVPKEGC